MPMVRRSPRLALPTLLALGTLVACGTMAGEQSDTRQTQDPPQPGTESSAQCNADRASWAIGQPATAEVLERIRADTGSTKARVLKPGMMVTMEYDGTRVNVDVNDRNLITGVRCG
ncbi:MAG TPA: I78 family peptidase inhibitor [Lysobacter sp.]|nr:I78 family peptidase inhibitor [Lysobacter sp.]